MSSADNPFAFLMCETGLNDHTAAPVLRQRGRTVKRWRVGSHKAPLSAMKTLLRLRDRQDERAVELVRRWRDDAAAVGALSIPVSETDEDARKADWPSRTAELRPIYTAAMLIGGTAEVRDEGAVALILCRERVGSSEDAPYALAS